MSQFTTFLIAVTAAEQRRPDIKMPGDKSLPSILITTVLLEPLSSWYVCAENKKQPTYLPTYLPGLNMISLNPALQVLTGYSIHNPRYLPLH